MPSSERLSFLCLVPRWQTPLVLMDEENQVRERRFSTASTDSSSSSESTLSRTSYTSSVSTDYGENGFLVLTASNNLEIIDEDELS
jgi:hypothetical protein